MLCYAYKVFVLCYAYTVVNFYTLPTFGSPFLKVPIFEYSTLNFGPIFTMFDKIRLYGVMARGQNLKYWKTDFIIGFPTLKLVSKHIFNFIAQLHC